MINNFNFEKLIRNYNDFIDSCQYDEKSFRLTKNSESSCFALCFAIFGYHLIGRTDVLIKNKDLWCSTIINSLLIERKNKETISLATNKSYLQLLCFSLSALVLLNYSFDQELCSLLLEVIPNDVSSYLSKVGVSDGKAGSGNFAMFLAIILLTLKDKYKYDVSLKLNDWIKFHINKINNYGFWGNKTNKSYLYFQNGYHQYEIFNYLSLTNTIEPDFQRYVLNFQDSDGFFAPYPGGGGCFDYDAVYLLTIINGTNYSSELYLTLSTLFRYQNDDGGFCESKYIRPKSFLNFVKQFNHLLFCSNGFNLEKFKYLISVNLKKNNTIQTHWTAYSRGWSESDLWDSWFRMLTIARIDTYLKISDIKWGFINFPGIGYHELYASKR